jgi:nucleoid DNA-binding protein
MLEKYIKELLFDHDCVVLPEFGGFITHYTSAEIHPITHKFNPPARRVAFNEQLKLNDGLLISTLTVKEYLTKEEAAHLVKEFVEKVKFQIKRYNQFVIKDIGRFFYNKENRLEFEPESKVNFLNESFGFTELYFKPIVRDFKIMSKVDTKVENQRLAVEKPKKKMKETEKAFQKESKGTSPFIFIIPVVLLLAGGGLAYYMNQEGKSLASLNPFSWFSGGEEKQTESLRIDKPVVVESAPEVVDPLASSTNESLTISSRTGRYFIVIGCFSNKDNAFKLKEQVAGQADKVSIIEPYEGKPFYTVSVSDFDNKKTAVSKMIELRKTYGNTIWVKKY